MRVSAVALGLMLIPALALAALMRGEGPTTKKDHCDIAPGVQVAFNQSYYDHANCAVYYCGAGRTPDHYHFVLETCGAVGAGPPCRVVPKTEGVYPDCCPDIECPPFDS